MRKKTQIVSLLTKWSATSGCVTSQIGNLALPPKVAIHQLQSKPCVEFAAVMCTATGETCDCAFDPAYARKIAPAIRATVDETRRITLRRKR